MVESTETEDLVISSCSSSTGTSGSPPVLVGLVSKATATGADLLKALWPFHGVVIGGGPAAVGKLV